MTPAPALHLPRWLAVATIAFWGAVGLGVAGIGGAAVAVCAVAVVIRLSVHLARTGEARDGRP